ncbi:MAG: hypothetical protein DME90_12360 [Verrucomicrobia bacterium]|nr:MAG: hypothetical protein DME90_12360 [Verrucomicrobiota bacterium]
MRLRVSNQPSKPLLIWDGECDFCRLWIERWREITAGNEPDGETSFAAEAVYRSLGYRSSRKWLAWSYDHVPGFAAISEIAYKFVARHRGLGSTLTRLLWGKDVRPPTYFWAQRWFLRTLGLTYLIAFVSLWVQVDGLVGSNGISPLNQFLPAVYERFGSTAYSLLPTLCWFDSSNGFLHFLCGGGVVLSLLLIVGVAPALSLVVLFVFYLSLTTAGQTFLSFQWDILLLETGFLSIFLAPWRLWPRELLLWPRSTIPATAPPVSRVGLFLLKVLLLKLMLMSGVVKLTSGDDCWWNLTALDYHYWSQPLPTVFGWWADKGPEWFKHFSVAFCLVVEIIVPFSIWAPRRSRLIAAGLMIFLQLVIALTGNYCFFNLLTIALCLLLIDDSVAAALWAAPHEHAKNVGAAFRSAKLLPDQLRRYAAIAVIVLTLPINVMTKDRDEIVIEGSADGIDWLPYEFKWKPGEVMRPPGWCAPHQPRLDWQMWFAALGSYRENPWFVRLIVRLLEGSQDVSRLLAKNPFPDEPPRYIRAMFYRYRFTTSRERRETGAWWKREQLREYLPTVSADQLREP